MTGVATRAPRLFGAAAGNLADHLAAVGPLPELDGAGVGRLVTDSGLTGRGGAGFPTGRKLAAVAAGGRAVVVANGAEGEPASSKDRALLTRAPHLVLDGLTLAARATGATEAHLYAPADLLARFVAPALRERRDRPRVALVPSADTFISGQESAVVAAVEGRPALPSTTPPAVFTRGVGGRPTLVQNVETLAHLALIARYGADWFRSVGTDTEPGTRLVTLSGAVRVPGVYEAAAGAPLGAVLGLAGGVKEPVQAVLVGGYHGGWVPLTRETAELPMTRAALAPYAAAPGAGVLIALPARRCGLQAATEITAYLAGQNAGQCGPCRNGLPALAAQLQALSIGDAGPGAVQELRRVAGIVDGRGACHHPSGTVRLVWSTLLAFADDIDHHAHGWCAADEQPRRPR